MTCDADDDGTNRRSLAERRRHAPYRRAARGAWATGLLTAAGLPVSASDAQSFTRRPTDPARLTAITQAPREEFGLTVETSAQATYDSNIFRADDRQTRATDDLIITPGLSARYVRPLGAGSFRLQGDALYDRYIANGDRSRFRVNLAGEARLLVAGRCLIQPSVRFVNRRADYGDINGPINNNQTFTTVALEASCPRAVGFYPVARAAYDSTRNTPTFAFADQTTQLYTAGLGFARPSLGRAVAYYTYLRSKRDAIGLVNRVDRFGLTFDRAVVSHLSLDFDGHYLDARSQGGVIRPYRGAGWDIGLTIRPIPRFSIRAGTGRRIVNDTLIPAGFAVQTDYTVRGDLRFSQNSSGFVSAEGGHRSFRRDPLLVFSPIGSDRYFEAAAGLTRTIGRRFDLIGEVRHVRRRTDSGLSNYDVTLVSLRAAARF